MNANQFMQHLESLGARQNEKEWATGKSWQEFYDTCHRGDWLLWLYRKSKKYNFQKITLAKGLCANTVRHLMKDERSLKAVDAAIAFGNGEISREELNAAADAAAAADTAAYAAHVAATYATDTAAAFVAADAAADAADAAAAYAAAAAAAAYAAADAADADAAARKVAFTAYAAARKENWQKTADIVREVLPFEIWEL